MYIYSLAINTLSDKDTAAAGYMKTSSAFKSLAAAEFGVKIKKRHYRRWCGYQELNRSGHELVPFVLETLGGIHKLAVDMLRKISNYVAQGDAPLSAGILLSYMKMVSTSVQLGFIEMVFKPALIIGLGIIK